MAKPIAITLRRQFAWLVVVLVALGAARLLAGQFMLASLDRDLARTAAAQAANHRMLQDLTDAETGVRGYQLTGDPAFLEPYRRGAGDYPLALRAALADADAPLRAGLREQDAAAQRWLVGFAIPAASTEGAGSLEADDSALGRELFDAYRRTNAAADTAIERQYRAETTAYHRAALVLEAALALLALASLGIALRIGRGTRRLLIGPLQHVQGVFDRLKGGDPGARATVAGPPELRALAEALNERLDTAAEARRRVHAQTTYLNQVLDAIDVAVLTCDADGAIVHLNRAARSRQAGRPPRSVAELTAVRGPDDGPHPLTRALAGETVDNHEMTAPGGPGGPRALLVDARPLHAADGAVIGAVTTGYDVTVLREREAELAAFAGIAAHDLKAPLTTIASYAEVLGEHAADPELDRLIGRIAAAVDRMRRLIDDLLAYATARDAPLRPAAVDLGRLVEDIAADRDAAAVGHGPLPVLCADPGMLRQLFENLIGNALKYSPPNRAAEVHVSAEPRGDGVRVVVADRGIGIPADQRDRVFTSFHRAHADRGYTGTGLGLAICARVVDRHGGAITAAANPGGGTRMLVDLPAAVLAPDPPGSADVVDRERVASGHAQPRA